MTKEEVLELVAEGWKPLIHRYYELIKVIESCDSKPSITVVDVIRKRGMLNIVAETSIPIIQEIIDKIAWAIERESVIICERCGVRGRRRMDLPGQPNRCRKHYIELANEMADRGEI